MDATPPEWCYIIMAAREFGCPPWEIENGSAVWYQRWKFMRAQESIKENEERAEMERQVSRGK